MIKENTHRKAFNDFAETAYERFDSIEEIILFGSVARGDHGARSDVDILVEVSGQKEVAEIENLAYTKASKYGVSITPIIKENFSNSCLKEGIENEGESYVRG